MHKYHNTQLRIDRENAGLCRCGSGGTTYRLKELCVQGTIRHPRDIQTPLTTDEIGPGDHRSFMFIFAVNEHYEFRAAPDGGPRNVAPTDAVKHETLFENADVLAAGEVRIIEGVISEINDASGSYNTRTLLQNDPKFAQDILKALDQEAIPANDAVRSLLLRCGDFE